MSRRVVGYRMVSALAQEPERIGAEAGALIEKGYQPWGSPLISGDWVLQAMICYAEPEPEPYPEPEPGPPPKRKSGRKRYWSS